MGPRPPVIGTRVGRHLPAWQDIWHHHRPAATPPIRRPSWPVSAASAAQWPGAPAQLAELSRTQASLEGHGRHLASWLGRGGFASWFLPVLAVAANAATGQNWPARTITMPRRRAMPAPRLLPYTVQLCIRCQQDPAASRVSPNRGQMARAHGACLAASNWTRAPITRSRPVVRIMREQAVRSRAGARLPNSAGAWSDPAAATRSGWPRLAAARGAWIIVAGMIVLLAGSIAATVIVRAASSSPRPAVGYQLAAHDAHFTALFPRRPLRIAKTAGTTTVIVYLADLRGYAVGIICAPVPASGRVRLDRAVNVAATALPGGDVVSRHRLTYHGQPAEDAAISVLGEPGQIRIVVFGSSAYIFEGFGATAASFAHDYKILLDTFTPIPYGATG